MSAPRIELTQLERVAILDALNAYRKELVSAANTFSNSFGRDLLDLDLAAMHLQSKLEIFDGHDNLIITAIAPQVQAGEAEAGTDT